MQTSQTTSSSGVTRSWQALKDYSVLMWRYRFFAAHLAASDVRARFRRSVLGVVWAMLQPLILAIMFAFVLVRLMNLPFEEYLVYVMTGFIMWEMITGACMLGAASLIGSHSYLMQHRMPTAIFAVRTILHLLVIFAAGMLSVAICAVFTYRSAFAPTWLMLPPFAFVLSLFCLPLAVICGILSALFRDFLQMLGLLLQALWLLSPVFIARQVFDTPGLATWTSLNPIASLCDFLRAILMHGGMPTAADLAVIAVWTAVLWLIAILLLVRFDRRIIFYM